MKLLKYKDTIINIDRIICIEIRPTDRKYYPGTLLVILDEHKDYVIEAEDAPTFLETLKNNSDYIEVITTK